MINRLTLKRGTPNPIWAIIYKMCMAKRKNKNPDSTTTLNY